MSIAIVEHGHLAYARGYGAARLKPAVPATAETRYSVDSVTKEFTAAAVLLLAEQGRLSLDDPLGNWFPGLGAAGAVTLRQLLNQTSGIRDYWPQDFLTPEMTRPVTTSALIDEWARRPLDFDPGSEWQYSNTNYVLAGAVVEKVSGDTLFEFLQSRIFQPLNMRGVVDYSAPDAPATFDAAGYTRQGLGPPESAPKEGSGWLFGAGNLAMSPSDLARWDLSLLDRTLLQSHSYEAEFSPVVLKNGRTQGYALGLEVSQAEGRLILGHSGAGSGFEADNRLWPQEKNAIIVMTNNDWAAPSDLSERIAFVFSPSAQTARAAALFQALQNGTIDRAQLSEIGNFHFTQAVLRDLSASLRSLGPARLVTLERESLRGGLITRRWKILCAGARLEVIERSRPDGKIDEFMITARND